MPYYTPLRYPGGKRRLAQVIGRLLDENGLRDVQYAEPYAGGAAVAIALLLEHRAAAIHINDLSRPVYAFWQTVLSDTADLCRRIKHAKVTMKEWHRQREVYVDREQADLSALGFAALFLNRTNRSGIIDGGVIGGLKQTGAWKLNARFNSEELIARIKRIARNRNRISVHQLDALEFTTRVVARLNGGFAFYDPPYIEKSEALYLNTYDLEGHRKVAAAVSALEQPWVVTYDVAALRENLYPRHRRIIYGLQYSAQDRYQGSEVMFISAGLRTPAPWRIKKSVPITADGCRYPLLGRLEEPKRRSVRH